MIVESDGCIHYTVRPVEVAVAYGYLNPAVLAEDEEETEETEVTAMPEAHRAPLFAGY